MTNKTDVTIYLYADLLTGRFESSNYNFWSSPESKQTGLYKSQTSAMQLLETRTISLSDYAYFDFTAGKIQALQMQLGDLHIQSENIKQQIQELLCIGHDQEEHAKEQFLGDEDHFYQADEVRTIFDDDLPF